MVTLAIVMCVRPKMTKNTCQPEKPNSPLANQSMAASNTAESINNMQSLSKWGASEGNPIILRFSNSISKLNRQNVL
jgi:hypothetical protein